MLTTPVRCSDIQTVVSKTRSHDRDRIAPNIFCSYTAVDLATQNAMSVETWELLSYMVTVLGLPLAVGVFLFEKRKERKAEEEEVYAALANSYQDFLRLALDNPDLRLMSQTRTCDLNPEQLERMRAIFGMLIALFERAYLLLFDTDLTGKDARRWRSWEDFMQEWCGREDFREAMPELLRGEDPEFAAYLQRLSSDATSASGPCND
jgi:hypothetical protein